MLVHDSGFCHETVVSPCCVLTEMCVTHPFNLQMSYPRISLSLSLLLCWLHLCCPRVPGCLACGVCVQVLVVGDSGLGKTTLISSLLSKPGEQLQVRSCGVRVCVVQLVCAVGACVAACVWWADVGWAHLS